MYEEKDHASILMLRYASTIGDIETLKSWCSKVQSLTTPGCRGTKQKSPLALAWTCAYLTNESRGEIKKSDMSATAQLHVQLPQLLGRFVASGRRGRLPLAWAFHWRGSLGIGSAKVAALVGQQEVLSRRIVRVGIVVLLTPLLFLFEWDEIFDERIETWNSILVLASSTAAVCPPANMELNLILSLLITEDSQVSA